MRIVIKTWTLICLFFIPYCSSIEVNQKAHDSFEQKYSAFKYSLNKDLKGLSYLDISRIYEKSPEESPVIRKLTAFYDNNRNEIKIYQNALMERFSTTKIDLSSLKESEYSDELEFVKNQSITGTIFQKEGSDIYASKYLKKIFLHPYYRINVFITFFLSRQLGQEGLAAWSIKNNIAAPLIKTEKINAGEWKIIYDGYEHVFFFKYNINTDTIYFTDIKGR